MRVCCKFEMGKFVESQNAESVCTETCRGVFPVASTLNFELQGFLLSAGTRAPPQLPLKTRFPGEFVNSPKVCFEHGSKKYVEYHYCFSRTGLMLGKLVLLVHLVS